MYFRPVRYNYGIECKRHPERGEKCRRIVYRAIDNFCKAAFFTIVPEIVKRENVHIIYPHFSSR